MTALTRLPIWWVIGSPGQQYVIWQAPPSDPPPPPGSMMFEGGSPHRTDAVLPGDMVPDRIAVNPREAEEMLTDLAALREERRAELDPRRRPLIVYVDRDSGASLSRIHDILAPGARELGIMAIYNMNPSHRERR